MAFGAYACAWHVIVRVRVFVLGSHVLAYFDCVRSARLEAIVASAHMSGSEGGSGRHLRSCGLPCSESVSVGSAGMSRPENVVRVGSSAPRRLQPGASQGVASAQREESRDALQKALVGVSCLAGPAPCLDGSGAVLQGRAAPKGGGGLASY